MLSTEAIVETAQRLLSRRFGGYQTLADVTELSSPGSSVVLRAKVTNPTFLEQRSLIVKYIPATGAVVDDAALLREVVAYQFTTSLPKADRPGPALIGYDIQQRILIITDAGDGDTLADFLESSHSEERLAVIRQLGRSLGRMHAATFGREDEFHVLMNRMLKQYEKLSDIDARRNMALLRSIDVGSSMLCEAGLCVPDTVSTLARDSRRRLESGKHRAFTPYDLAPDNIILADGLKFLDYEWAGFRDVTFDLAGVIAGFPQYLFSRPIADEEVDVLIEAWASEVSPVWSRVKDRQHLNHRLLAALIGWALSGVALLQHGTLYSLVDGGEEGGETTSSESSDVGDILRPAGEEPFSDSEILIRADLTETFSALARFVSRMGEPDLASVQTFAQDVVARLES